MRHNLTNQFVESFKAPRNGKDREIAWDAKQPGFGLRVTDNGARSWVVMYRHHNRARFMTLGTYPATTLADARDRARDALSAAQDGKDPASEKQIDRSADSWASLCERFLTERCVLKKCRPRTVEEYEKIIRRELIPAWGNRKAKDITRADVKALIGKIRARGVDVQANRTLMTISAIANFGVKEEVLEFNPAARMDMSEEKSRTRYLKPDEIRRVWATLGPDEPQANWMKLLLLTGQRSSEVAEMAWDEIDFETNIWTIPGERTKNGLPHRVPLVGQALAILQSLPRDGERVFAHSRHSARGKCADRIRKASGVVFTPHDLRRTLSTHLAELRVRRADVKKVLNHSRRTDVTDIYDRYEYDPEKREALEKWDRHISFILTGERPKVIELRATA